MASSTPWKAKNREAAREYDRNYYDAHRDEILEQRRARRAANPEADRRRSREYRARNADVVLQRERGRRAVNIEADRRRSREYAAANREAARRRAKARAARFAPTGSERRGSWSADEDLIAMRDDLTVPQIATLLNRTYQAVVRRRYKLTH